MNDVYENLFEQYIQSGIPSTGTDVNLDLTNYNTFINSKQSEYHRYPGLEAKLIFNTRQNLFEVIDDWLENELMTLENHRIYEILFRRYKLEDGSRKSKIRKSKNRKSKNRKSKY